MDQNTAQTTPVLSADDSTVLPPAPIEPDDSTDTPSPTTEETPTPSADSQPIETASSEPVNETPTEQAATDVASVEPTAEMPAELGTSETVLTDQPSPTPPPATTDMNAPAPAANPADMVTPEEREKMYHDLAETMLKGLETGEIEVEASEDSSEYILEHLDKLQTRTELMAFLEEVGNRWPVYKTLTTKEVTEENDQNQIENIQDQLHQFIKE